MNEKIGRKRRDLIVVLGRHLCRGTEEIRDEQKVRAAGVSNCIRTTPLEYKFGNSRLTQLLRFSHSRQRRLSPEVWNRAVWNLWNFGEIYCLHSQGRIVIWEEKPGTIYRLEERTEFCERTSEGRWVRTGRLLTVFTITKERVFVLSHQTKFVNNIHISESNENVQTLFFFV